ncbi:DNA-processing protein DprA [Gallaecimonas pentaromativorans]|uniref:DNA-processing protein DprA n=1 Tax=Gallaecimonas pentaromativorans TaxID=584787 RepID=UPI0009F85A54|nr:DNA-processing protein DprA [Gallaecimonas pentaromativorans]
MFNNDLQQKILAIILRRKVGLSLTASNRLLHEANGRALSSEKEILEFVKPHVKADYEFSERNVASAVEALQKHEMLGIEVVPITSARYPKALYQSPNPPAALFVRGHIDVLDELPGVAVVGSRDISANGAEITRRITEQLVEQGYVIVSGLALGVDAAAHRASLQSKGKTIAVLAGGVDNPTPKQNQRLAEEILDAGGLVLSEYPVGNKPFRDQFVERNRIQVGLSCGSVIIEAALKSGTMTQADFCTKAKRPLFAVVPHLPANPLKLHCEGTQELVSRGQAIPLRTKKDYDELSARLLEFREQFKSIPLI